MKKPTKWSPVSKCVSHAIKGRRGQLMANIMTYNALLNRLMVMPKPKPPTKAQIAKRERDRKLGEKYLAMAYALGIYEERDYD